MDENFERGFLPPVDPLIRLPEPFDAWEEIAPFLSKLALTPHMRTTVEQLPPFPTSQLGSLRATQRAMALLSYMANLYVFAPGQPPAAKLPPNLACGWYEVATKLQRPPVLSYASQTLHNWRRIDPDGPVAVGNLTLIQNYLGGMDEEWFVTIHTQIEAEAAPAIRQLVAAQSAVPANDVPFVERTLRTIADVLVKMDAVLALMPERCEPFIYYNRVRPYMFGWKDNPLLPDGMIYEGVEAYGNRPVQFRGETGAQSSIIAALDEFLGVTHEFDEMRAYLNEMREYMPASARNLITRIEAGPSIRSFVEGTHARHPNLRSEYNRCIQNLYAFRRRHIEYAARYIIAPAKGDEQGEVGTGGTPFTVYLKKHIRETEAHLL